MAELILPKGIRLLFSIQPSQIPLDQILIVLCLCKLLKPFLNLFLQALHLAEFPVIQPVLSFPEAGLLLLQGVDLFGALAQNLPFFLRKGLDLLHILQIGGHHVVLKFQLFQFLGGFCDLLQASLHIFLALLLVVDLQIVSVIDDLIPVLYFIFRLIISSFPFKNIFKKPHLLCLHHLTIFIL